MALSGHLQAAEAARRLGLSAKALRLYERRGLLAPIRTEAGWRAYSPAEMERAREIADLRALGLGLAEIASVLSGPAALLPVLAAHQAKLEGQLASVAARIESVWTRRAALGRDADAPGPAARPGPAFDLPWPWAGERFAMTDIGPLTFVVGPLFSGKTRLLRAIAESLPEGRFAGLDRLAEDGAAARRRIAGDPLLGARVRRTLRRLARDGAAATGALVALVAALEGADGPLAIDLVEEGLDGASQRAVAAHLRRRSDAAPLVATTRSDVILDLAASGPGEAVILCPANHEPPRRVVPVPGAPGYEAVATCLGPPEARARTAGIVAIRRATA